MYKAFFHLASDPFKLTPDTDCFFFEGQRKAILDALLYAITRGDGLIKVVGEVGSGKTILLRMLIQSLPEHFETVYLVNPRIPPDQILQAIALELKLADVDAGKALLLNRLQNKLLALHARYKQTVLLIDEAQAMPLETLEEIRMLGNLETGQDKLLQIVLFGQPELDKTLDQHCVRQIKERIIHNFYLPGLSRQEVGRYLFFRLQVAGFKGAFPFSASAVALITWRSGGIIRKINVLAEKCLLAAYCQQQHKIGLLTVVKVVLEHKRSGFWKILSGLAVLLVMLAWPTSDIEQSSDKPPAVSKRTKPVLSSLHQGHAQVVEKTVEKSAQSSSVYAVKLLSIKLKGTQQVSAVLNHMIPQGYRSYVFYRILKDRWCEVFLGPFEDFKTAQATLDELSSRLKKNQPYVLKIPQTNWQQLKAFE